MKRKIVQHGSSSLTITLPRAWVIEHHLGKGDEVGVELNGKQLTVTAKPEFKAEKKVVEVSEFGIFTKNNLSHLYLLGYDEIEIHFSKEQELRNIKATVPECIGFEIIDQKPNMIFIKSIAHTLEADFDVLLRKAFIITKEMGTDMLEAIEKGDYEKLKELRHQESLNNKFTLSCARLLNKRGYRVPRRTLQMYELVKQLERVADEYKHICDVLSGYKSELSASAIELFSRVNDYFNGFYKLFYRFSPELKEYIYKERIALLEKSSGLMESLQGREVRLVHHLSNLVTRVYDCAGAYFALIL